MGPKNVDGYFVRRFGAGPGIQEGAHNGPKARSNRRTTHPSGALCLKLASCTISKKRFKTQEKIHKCTPEPGQEAIAADCDNIFVVFRKCAKSMRNQRAAGGRRKRPRYQQCAPVGSWPALVSIFDDLNSVLLCFSQSCPEAILGPRSADGYICL